MNDSDGPRLDDDPVRRYLLGQLTEEEAEDLARRFLLGQLAEEEAARLEEAFGNDELFDLVEAVEADLLDALAQGTLPPAEADLVRGRLAATPRGRERLALEEALARVATEPELALEETLTKEAVEQNVVQFEPRKEVGKPRAAPARRWVSRRWAAAAAFVLLVGVPVGMWFFRPPGVEVVASIDLPLLVHRGADAVQQLPVPEETDRVEDRVEIRVDLGYEPGDTFQAVVHDVGGDEVWSAEHLAVQPLPSGARGVTLVIDADDLPPGRYTLEVWQAGVAVNDEGEGFVGEQEFEVVRT